MTARFSTRPVSDMLRIRTSTLALIVLAPLAAWGCGGDSAGPSEGDLRGLDPVALADAVTDLVAPLAGVSDVVANFEAAFEDLEQAGVEHYRVEGVVFPPALAGRTLVYDLDRGGWVVDESRDDAPADGVRVVWYRLDGTGELAFPLDPMGHIDLTGGTDPELEELRIDAVETASGRAVTLLDFVQGYAVTDASTRFEAEGLFSDANAVTEFAIELVEASGGAVDLAVTLDGGGVRYELVAEGSDATSGLESQDAMTVTVSSAGSRTALEMSFGGSDGSEEAHGTLSRDGAVVATVEADGSLYAFTPVGGGEFSATQTSGLNALVRTLLLAGLEPFSRLPLLLP